MWGGCVWVGQIMGRLRRELGEGKGREKEKGVEGVTHGLAKVRMGLQG